MTHTKQFIEFMDDVTQQLGHKPIICIDMDGTMLKSDMTLESFKMMLRCAPYKLLQLLWKIPIGMAQLKHVLADICDYPLDFTQMQLNEPLLAALPQLRNSGYTLVLATAANIKLAQKFADHTGLFDEVIASDAQNNYRAQYKAEILNAKYGSNRYIYIGNSNDDLKVWPDSCAIVAVPDNEKIKMRIHELSQATNKKTFCFEAL